VPPRMPRSAKTEVILEIFRERWDNNAAVLLDPVVTLDQVQKAVDAYNEGPPKKTGRDRLSTKNPANFLKDLVRSRNANAHWPQEVLDRGYTARQLTGGDLCFEFVPLANGQTEPFPALALPGIPDRPPHLIESISIPLASRRLGRSDEPWLTQVAVKLRIIETHLAIHSPRRVVQLDHLQNGVKLRRSEIDALFLAVEEVGEVLEELIVTCEAKSLREEVVADQVLRQVKAVFHLEGVTQDLALPLVLKAIGESLVQVYEFDVVAREDADDLEELTLASSAVYELVPHVPGIGW
jgi:hypothetical protein